MKSKSERNTMSVWSRVLFICVLGFCAIAPVDGDGHDVGSFVPAASTSPSPWPTFHHDNLRTGLSPVITAANTGTLVWEFQPGTGGFTSVESSPAIGGDGTIYVGADDDSIYALNPNGALKWLYATRGPVIASPTLASDGTIYIPSLDGNLYALNPDGTLKWQVAGFGGGRVNYSPAVGSDGTVYLISASGNLFALNPDGTLKWEFNTGVGGVYGTPAIGSNGTIYVAGSYLYALNADGSSQWGTPLGNGQINDNALAIGGDGTIYVESQSNLMAFAPNGSVKWSYPAGNVLDNSPAVGADGTIYIYSSLSSTIHNIYAINPDGSLKWQFPTDAVTQYSSPALGADGSLYVGSRDGYIYALNADGSLKWQFATGHSVNSSPAIGADGTLYVGSGDANIGTGVGGLFALSSLTAGKLAISSITPTMGGNAGQVTITAYGSGIAQGATAVLQGASTVNGSNTSLTFDSQNSNAGETLSATFDLTGQSPGALDFVLTNPNGTSIRLPGAFTIQSGGAYDVKFELLGPVFLRAGEGRTYYASASNSGSIDAPGVVAFVTIPSGIELQTPLPNLLNQDGSRTLFIIGGEADLAPGAYYNVPIRLNVPDTPAYAHQNFQLSAQWQAAIEPSLPAGDPTAQVRLASATASGGSAQMVFNVASSSGSGQLSLQMTQSTVTTLAPSSLTVTQAQGQTTLQAQFDDPTSDYIQWSAVVNAASAVWDGVKTYGSNAVQAVKAALGVKDKLMLLGELDKMTNWLQNNGYITLGDEQQLLTDIQNQDDWELHVEAPEILACVFATGGTAALACDAAGNMIGLFSTAGVAPYARDLFDGMSLVRNSVPTPSPYQCNNPQNPNSPACQIDNDLDCGTGTLGCEFYGPQELLLDVKKTYLASQQCNQQPSGTRFTRVRSVTGAVCVLPQSGTSTLAFQTIVSGDPNDLSGPPGVGPTLLIQPDQALSYQIFFSNEPTASAPAQMVVITDQLDPTKMDLSTFAFGPISFGNHILMPPAGAKQYSAVVDLRPVQTLAVHINASLDATGLLTWTYASIDPTTGSPPTDATVGFLPPDTNPPDGEGDVVFSVLPKIGIATNTQVSDQAAVAFDVNPPINTQAWANTIGPQAQANAVSSNQNVTAGQANVSGGTLTVTNTSRVAQTITSVTVNFSDPKLFSSATLTANINGTQVGVAGPMSPLPANGTVIFSFPSAISLAPAASVTFTLTENISMTVTMMAGFGSLGVSGGLAGLGILLMLETLMLGQHRRRRRRRVAIAALGLLLLTTTVTGCGGGGGGGGGNPPLAATSTQSVPVGGINSGALTIGGLPVTLGTVTLP